MKYTHFIAAIIIVFNIHSTYTSGFLNGNSPTIAKINRKIKEYIDNYDLVIVQVIVNQDTPSRIYKKSIYKNHTLFSTSYSILLPPPSHFILDGVTFGNKGKLTVTDKDFFQTNLSDQDLNPQYMPKDAIKQLYTSWWQWFKAKLSSWF